MTGTTTNNTTQITPDADDFMTAAGKKSTRAAALSAAVAKIRLRLAWAARFRLQLEDGTLDLYREFEWGMSNALGGIAAATLDLAGVAYGLKGEAAKDEATA